MDIRELLQIAVDNKASDIHLLCDSPATIRVNGVLLSLNNKGIMTQETIQDLVWQMVNNEQREILTVNREVDFSFEFESKARFRVNAYFQKGTLAASLRLIPFEIRSIEELGLPKICHTFAKLRQGFILYTGPTGCGKSTTIAAIVNEINQERQEHIVTIEDPIEFIFPKGKSLVSQRGLHSDTHSWDIALRSILREDPNIVFIGEMRDYETISSALTIAETGHLVFATLHTNSAAQSIDRIVDVFPEHAKGQVRMQLSLTLEAVVSQRLLPSLDRGRVVATEIMIATPAVRNSIREGKTHMLDNIIQTSGELGMMTFEASLASLVREGKVSREIAEEYALRPDELARQLRGK
jgi:twitching motility protein PilT